MVLRSAFGRYGAMSIVFPIYGTDHSPVADVASQHVYLVQGRHQPPLTAVHTNTIVAEDETVGRYAMSFEQSRELLFCDNETNAPKLFGAASVRGGARTENLAEETADALRERQPGAP